MKCRILSGSSLFANVYVWRFLVLKGLSKQLRDRQNYLLESGVLKIAVQSNFVHQSEILKALKAAVGPDFLSYMPIQILLLLFQH